VFQEERRAKTLSMVREGKSLTVKKLTDIFGVSEATIRRDLTFLEENGFIVRTHGGVISKESIASETLYSARSSENLEEKARIAQKAYEFINSNEVIILDAGTTVLELARQLRNFRKRLVVITHSLDIAHVLADANSIQVIQLGGSYNSNSRAFSGSMTRENLSTFHANKAFLGVNGISPKYGLTTPFIEEAQMKSNIISVSDETFVLGDHSKFGKVFVKKIVDIDQIDYIITGDNISSLLEKEFEHLPLNMIKTS
jgi:DeoR family fructose operon transcriptional repressor